MECLNNNYSWIGICILAYIIFEGIAKIVRAYKKPITIQKCEKSKEEK